MAIITIRTPPDGDDISTAVETRILTLLPPGVTPREAILRLLRKYVRQKELQGYAENEQALRSSNIRARADALANDPDLGPDLPV